jgi:hypothetical protein
MKKIVRLTESDLIKLVKRVISEQDDFDDEEGLDIDKGNEDVQYVVKTLLDSNLVDKDVINIYEDSFEVYSIKGKNFDYFTKADGYLVFEVERDDDYITIFFHGEDYDEDELDVKWRKEVYGYLLENWDEPLYENNILISIKPSDELYDEFE